MNWLTLKLMQYQLKKAQKQHEEETHSVIKRAKADMVKSYKNTIMFIKANSK